MSIFCQRWNGYTLQATTNNQHSQWKIIEWTRKFHSHGSAKEIPCPMKEFLWFCIPEYFPWWIKSSFQQGLVIQNIFLRKKKMGAGDKPYCTLINKTLNKSGKLPSNGFGWQRNAERIQRLFLSLNEYKTIHSAFHCQWKPFDGNYPDWFNVFFIRVWDLTEINLLLVNHH